MFSEVYADLSSETPDIKGSTESFDHQSIDSVRVLESTIYHFTNVATSVGAHSLPQNWFV